MTNERSTWAVGYEVFAAVMLMLIGAFHAFAGLVALINDEFYVVGKKWVFQFDITTWGWIHLILGIVLVLAGIGVLTGNLAARIVGVIVASLSAIAAFMYLPWYPIWAIVVIAVDIAVIWALTAHGRDVEAV